MADPKDAKSGGGDVYVHSPLPYIVVLRATMSEDAASERFEQHVTAYSLMEAMMQAIMEATGAAPESTKYTIESIGPDTPVYIQRTLQQLADIRKK